MLEQGFAATDRHPGTGFCGGRAWFWNSAGHRPKQRPRAQPQRQQQPPRGTSHSHSHSGEHNHRHRHSEGEETKQCRPHTTTAVFAHRATAPTPPQPGGVTTAVAHSPTHMLHSMIRCAHTCSGHSPVPSSVVVPQPGAVPHDAAAATPTALVGLVQAVVQGAVVARTQQARTPRCLSLIHI